MTTNQPDDEQRPDPVAQPAPPPPPPSFDVPPASPPPPAPPPPGVRFNVPQDQKNLAMVSTLGILIAGFLAPLLVFVFTNGDPAKRFANDHAKQGLNFCIAQFIGWIVTLVLMFVVVGFLLIPVLLGWALWVIIAGTIQASNGEAPNYPLVPKILK